MLEKPRLKVWPVFFSVIFFEGIIILVWLMLIPQDAKNGILFGFSSRRLLMMIFTILIMALSAAGMFFSMSQHGGGKKWIHFEEKPGLLRGLTIGALILSFGLELTWLLLRFYDPARLAPLYIRFLPILVYLLVICVQALFGLLVLRFGRELILFWRQGLLWTLGWACLSALVYWTLSPAGAGILHTWWYIQTFDPARYERNGANYCSAAHSGSLDSQYTRASDLRRQLANIDRDKTLLAIFNKITAGARTNTEKQLKLLEFIQKVSIHTSIIPSYSKGDWVYDPLVLLELGDMWCTQGAILAIDLYGAAGYPGRLVQLGHHQIAEIYYDSGWHYFDTDLFGNGETVLDNQGNFPSVAEMSRTDFQKIDALPVLQESNVADCTAPDADPINYPSYSYFSSQSYLTDAPQGYFLGLGAADNFEHGWKPVDQIAANDVVVEQDLAPRYTPSKPVISTVQLNAGSTSLTVAFSATDPDHDLAGYQIFVSEHSRGWDYNQFYGSTTARAFWADSDGWKPEMYAQLFQLPPSDMGVVILSADKTQVSIPVKHGLTYYITIMAYDSYGKSVGRSLFPESNELKITVP
jgi:hypothetical protein